MAAVGDVNSGGEQVFVSKNAQLCSPASTSRRSVVRGAAWSVPVVAMAATAPAYAASPCDLQAYRLDWDGGSTAQGTTAWERVDYTSGTATVNASQAGGGSAISVSFASTWSGSTTTDQRDQSLNMTVPSSGNIGNLSPSQPSQGRALYIRHQSPITAGRNRRQQIVITFSRPVYGLSFTITDIDSTSNAYWDRVELTAATASGANATYSYAGAAPGIQGSGGTTIDTAFRQGDSDTTFNADRSGGNVPITFASNTEVKTLTLAFYTATGGGQQAIYLTDMAFSARGC